MNFLKILFDVHVSQTTNVSPFPINVEFDYNKFNYEKYKFITENNDNYNNFAKTCFDIFLKKNPNLPKGSVHVDHIVWTKFAIKSIIESYNSKKNIITFPNGCCSINNCPINIYYLIVLENIMLNE